MFPEVPFAFQKKIITTTVHAFSHSFEGGYLTNDDAKYDISAIVTPDAQSLHFLRRHSSKTSTVCFDILACALCG